MSNTKKFEGKMGGPDSDQSGCALSSDWVRTVGNTVVYPSLTNTNRSGNSTHREDFNRMLGVAARKRPQDD